MAIKARVNNANPRDERVEGDESVEVYRVVFFGTELPVPDASLIEVRYADADTLATARTKVVDAAVAEWNRVRAAHGLPTTPLARARVAFFELARGS